MYEVMEYTIMSDVYDEYVSNYDYALEGFGKKRSFGQKIINFIKKILAKIRYIITGKKSKKEVVIDNIKEFAQPIKFILTTSAQVGVCSVILTGILKVFWMIEKKIPGLNNNVATLSVSRDLLQKNADLDDWIRNFKNRIDQFEAMNESDKKVARQQFHSGNNINELKNAEESYRHLLDRAQYFDTVSRADGTYVDPRIVKTCREIIPKAIDALSLINKYFQLMEA